MTANGEIRFRGRKSVGVILPTPFARLVWLAGVLGGFSRMDRIYRPPLKAGGSLPPPLPAKGGHSPWLGCL